MWFLLALASGFFAATLAILVKLHLQHFNPFFITFLFSAFMAITFFMIDLFTQKIDCLLITSLSYREWGFLLLASTLNGLGFTCYITALQSGKTAGVIALDRLGIIFVIILSAIFLQQSLSIKAVLGAMLMIAGSILLTW